MITITNKKDKKQLRLATFQSLRKADYEALKTWVRVLGAPPARISKATLEKLSYDAAHTGEEDLLEYLLKYDKNVEKVFRTLVAYGHLELLLKFQAKYNLQLKDIFYDASLLSAIRNKHLNLVEYLYEQGCRTKNVVLRAVEFNAFEITEYLLEQGEEPSSSALVYASNFGLTNYIALLIKHGAVIGKEAVKGAAEFGQLDVLKYYVEQGFNLKDLGEYLIYYTAHNGHVHVLKYLKEQGLDLREGNDMALIWAGDNIQIDAIKYLVENGADIRVKDDDLCVSAGCMGSLELSKYLIEQAKDAETKRLLAAKILSHTPKLNALHELVVFLKGVSES